MNSNTQKLVAYAALALVCALIVAVWGLFAFYGKTPVDGFISQLGGLLTIVVGAIAALGATHVASAASSNPKMPPGTQVTYNPPVTVLNTAVSSPSGAVPAVPEVPANAQQ